MRNITQRVVLLLRIISVSILSISSNEFVRSAYQEWLFHEGNHAFGIAFGINGFIYCTRKLGLLPIGLIQSYQRNLISTALAIFYLLIIFYCIEPGYKEAYQLIALHVFGLTTTEFQPVHKQLLKDWWKEFRGK